MRPEGTCTRELIQHVELWVRDRMAAGLNHLAVRGDRAAVTKVALDAGWTQRIDTGEAIHVTNEDGFELELRE